MSRCRRIVDQFLYRACVDRSLAVMSRPKVNTSSAPAGLRRAALKCAKQDDGRASDAVRKYLETNKAADLDRGKLLAQARQIMLDAGAKLPPVPTSFKPMPMPSEAKNTSAGVNSPLYTIEAFSGGGLWELASAIEGNVIIGSCENNENANKTRIINNGWLNNIGPLPEETDARKWSPPIRTKRQGGPNIDLLFGGPVCKPFSAGSRLGRSKAEQGWSASDNYFPLTLDWMVDLQPRVVVWENAPSLSDPRTDHNKWIRRWQDQAKHIGYDSVLYGLDSAEFGNPTSRRRTFVVAWPTGAWWGAALKKPPVGNFSKPQSPEVKSGKKLPYVPAMNRLLGGCCNNYGLVDCEFLGNYAIRCRTCVDGNNFVPAANTSGTQARRNMKKETVPLDKEVTLHRTINQKYKKDRVLKKGEHVPWTTYVQLKVGGGRERIRKFTPADLAGVWVGFVSNAKELPGLGRRVSKYLMRTVVPGFATKHESLIITDQIDPQEYRRSDESRDDVNGRWDDKTLAKLKAMSVRDIAKLQDVPQWYKISGARSPAISQLGMGVPINLGRAVIRHVRAALNLPLRAPWWETEVPRTPHSPRFETVEQVAASTQGERKVKTKQGNGSGWPDGLWPMQTFSMCYGYPGLVGPLPIMPGGMEDAESPRNWIQLLAAGKIGSQMERAKGRSKQQMRPDINEKKYKNIPRFAEIFTGDGLSTKALWQTGWRSKGQRTYPDHWVEFIVSRFPDNTGTFYTGLRAEGVGYLMGGARNVQYIMPQDFVFDVSDDLFFEETIRQDLGEPQLRLEGQFRHYDLADDMWPEYFSLEPFNGNHALLFGLHDRLSLEQRGWYEEAVEERDAQDPFYGGDDGWSDHQLFPIAPISEFPELTNAVVKEFRDTFFKGKSIAQARSEMKKAAARFVEYEEQA